MTPLMLSPLVAGHKPRQTLLQVTAMLTAIVGTLSFPATSTARKVQAWSYNRLFQTSDIVVIGTAINTGPTNQKWAEPIFDPHHFRGVITSFRVASILKGSPPKTIQVLHYAYVDFKSPMNDGPGLVSFMSSPSSHDIQPQQQNPKEAKLLSRTRQSQNSAPEYLLFLKKRQDGTFAAASGQVDPIFSVRAVLNLKALPTR